MPCWNQLNYQFSYCKHLVIRIISKTNFDVPKTKCVSTSQIFVTVDNQQNLHYSRCCSQACYKNTAQSLFIQFRDINSIYCCSVKSYEKKWDENFPVILGLGMKALKVVRKLIGLLFVKNKSDCWR